MSVTISSTDRNLSTKYQIPLEFENDLTLNPTVSTDVFVKVEIQSPLTLIYQVVAKPFRQSGDKYLYKIDLSPILDVLLNPIEFTGDFATLSVYEEVYLVSCVPDVGGSGTYTTKFNKFRLDFYTYWNNVASNLNGATFPSPALIYRESLNCYIDDKNTTALQTFSLDSVTDVKISWVERNGSTSNETISFGGAGVYNPNIDLDTILNLSALFTIADRLDIASFSAVTTTQGFSHNITVHDLTHCKQEPFSITYLNDYGLWESLAISAMWKESLNLAKDSYRRDATEVFQLPNQGAAGTFDSQDIMTPNFHSSYIREFNIVTDWLDEYQMEQFKLAASGQEIWIKMAVQETVSGVWSSEIIAANITDNKVIVKKRHSDKIYNLDMTIQLQPINR